MLQKAYVELGLNFQKLNGYYTSFRNYYCNNRLTSLDRFWTTWTSTPSPCIKTRKVLIHVYAKLHGYAKSYKRFWNKLPITVVQSAKSAQYADYQRG